MVSEYLQKNYEIMMKENQKFRTMSIHEKASAMNVCLSTMRRIENPGWLPPEERARALEKDNQRLKKILDQYLDIPKKSDVSYNQHLRSLHKTLHKMR